jgi:PKD repeat protein
VQLSPAFSDKEMLQNCDFVQLPGLDMNYVKGEDTKLPKDGGFHEIGRAISANLTMENSGTWYDLADGRKVWVLRVKTPGAIATTSEIFDFFIPAGAQFFIYDPAGQTRYGAYTVSDNGDFFGSDMVKGDEVVYEYVQPANVNGTPRMTIRDIFHLYRDVEFVSSSTKDFGTSASCEVNVRCSPVGDNWSNQRRGVAKIYVVVGSMAGYCSGTLINNVAQDCKKYFLTAYHCATGGTPNYAQWRFYFNWESATCTNPTTQPAYNMMTGSTLKSSGNITGGSDFLLLELTGTIQASWNLYMNGWNAGTSPSGPGVSIHHPDGDIKKISTYNTMSTSTWSGGASNAHWRVVWVSNSNGWGVTEGGSSGSPIFDNGGKVIGTLTGGGSYCTAQSQPDYYGKMSYHWTSNGTASSAQLKPWLDPASSGVTTLTGMNCPGTATLNADFSGSPTTVTIGQAVTFTNASSGNPTTYSWNFGSGASLATATTAGPHSVSYSTLGYKTVTLTVGDGSTTDTETKTNYINVVDQPTGCDTMHYPLTGTPTLYSSSTGGYVSGNNAYGDKAKADFFSGATTGWTISDAYIYFGVATGSSSQVPVKIWNDNGTGGAPNTVLGTVNVPISTIVSNVTAQTPTLVHFATPVVQDGTFFVGVTLPTTAGDTVAIVTNQDGDTSPGTAWEQWSDNVWYPYSSTSAWELNVQHAIWPILCNPTNVSVSAASSLISMYPNPAQDKLNFYFGSYQGNVEIVISDILGKEIMRQTLNVNNMNSSLIDISSLKTGVYIVNGIYGNNSFTDKLQIIK